jgi:hypothetical protein
MAADDGSLGRRYLTDRLWALRRLPPGTPLAELPRPDERRLFAEVLAEHAEDDVFTWLARERGPVVAAIALRALLEYLRDVALAQRRSRAAGYLSPVETLTLVGDLLLVPDGDLPFPWEQQPPDTSPEALRRAFHRVQERRGRPDEGPSPGRRNARDRLLVQLLGLPPDADPLRWLHEAHGPAAAELALGYLMLRRLSSVTAAPDVGTIVRAERRHAVLRMPGARLVITTVTLGTKGFSLVGRGRIGNRRLRDAAPWPAMPDWLGFNRVTDDRGYRYLVHGGRSRWMTGPWPWHWSGQVEMVYSPAPAPGATAMTFVADPAAMAAVPEPWNPDGLQQPMVYLGGPVVWRFALPR